MVSLDYLPHYTYDDYKLWEGHWELFEGIPVAMTPSPMINHQAIATKFIAQLDGEAGACDQCLVLVEEDDKLSDDTVLRPDVVLVCDEMNDAYITKAPEIIIEIISKTTMKNDENYKFHQYESEKVKYYILAYPDELYAKVYQLVNDQYEKKGDYSHSAYCFDEAICPVTIDFGKIFKQLRK